MNNNRIAATLGIFVVAASAVLGMRLAVAGDTHSGHGHAAKAKQAAGSEKGSKAKGAAYPLDTCPVAGEKLGSMGDPIDYNYKGRDIKFCCKSCIPKFEKNPAKYIAEIDKKIIAKQVKSYPLSTCIVTGDKLGSMGDPVDYVYKSRLVRFCCKSCIENFNSDPAKYLSKIDKAAKAKSKSS